MKVWVTRDEEQNGPLAGALLHCELDVVHEPVVERHRVAGWNNDCVESLGEDDLLVLTSPYAVQLLASLTSCRAPGVAVVGESSKKIAEDLGFRVMHVAPQGDAQSLLAELEKNVTSGRVCYPRSQQARERKAWAQVQLSCPVLYDTCPRQFDRTVVDRVDIVSVTSPSAVRAIGKVDKPFASLGPTTSSALRENGVEPVVEAPHRLLTSLADAIARYQSESRHQRA